MVSALDMALDEMIETSSKGKGRGKGGGRGKGKGWGRGSWDNNGDGGRNKSEGNDAKKLDMTLDEVIDASEKGKGRGKGKGKGKYNGDGSNDSWGSSWNSSWGGGGAKTWNSSWSNNQSWGNKGSWGKDTKSGGKSTGKGSSWTPPWNQHDDWRATADADNGYDDDWFDSKPRGTHDRRWESGGPNLGRGAREEGWARSAVDPWADGGGARRAAPAREVPPVSRVPAEREPARESVRGRAAQPRGRAAAEAEERETRRTTRTATATAGSKRRTRSEDERPVPAQERTAKRIKVANVPRDLGKRDIKEAFEAEAGDITSCEITGNTAWITFKMARDARKAVETFDHGELNGKTISVSLA